jgi:hypothetical protein
MTIHFSKIGVCSILVALSGCGLFGGHSRPNIENAPPYYQSALERDREKMSAEVTHFRNTELEKLQKIAEDDGKGGQDLHSAEKIAKNEDEAKKKGWFGGSQNFLRSDEAARINANLDR